MIVQCDAEWAKYNSSNQLNYNCLFERHYICFKYDSYEWISEFRILGHGYRDGHERPDYIGNNCYRQI